jgi:octaheme c-type cytochrome (tetrathionate reductase family)
VNIASNECSCTKCHAGYGWSNDSFDFSNSASVDCLICHADPALYSKANNTCGYPDKDVDLTEAAKSVDIPARSSCGACHWYGGGGNNVKHGDMDNTLASPDPAHDVHMGGLDFTCQECHVTDRHRISGSSTTSAVSEGSVACTDCHDEKPHDASSPLLAQLNDHCDAIACQTCHIPRFAKAAATVTLWDWSKSGGEEKLISRTDTREEYLSRKKGLLVKEKNVRPAYCWYNGKHRRYLKGDKVNLNGITCMNPPDGDIRDPSARITPYKNMHGVEPADEKYRYLIAPMLFGNGYFESFDWHKAAEQGMAAADLKFSGDIRFVETCMRWRVNHEVAPAKDALSCLDCHHSDGVMDFKALGYKGDPAATGGRLLTPDAEAKK